MAAVVQAAGNNDFGSTISTPAFGAGVTSGNDVLVITQENDTMSVASVTDNQAGTYTLLDTVTAGSSEFKLWRRQAIADAPTTFSATLSSGSSLFSIFAFEAEPTGSYVGNNTSTGTGTSPSLSITVAATEALLLGLLGLDGDSTGTGSGGSSVVQPYEFGSAPGGSTSFGWGVYRETAASGSQALAITLGTNRTREYAAFAVENGGGGGGSATPTLMMLGIGS